MIEFWELEVWSQAIKSVGLLSLSSKVFTSTLKIHEGVSFMRFSCMMGLGSVGRYYIEESQRWEVLII